MSPPRNVADTALANGDIIITGRKSQGIVHYAIVLGSKLRFGFKSPFTIWSHCAIVTNASIGEVTEAVSSGVKRSLIKDRFPEGDYAIIHTGAKLERRDWLQMEAFLNAVVAAKWKYGFVQFFGLALYCLTGSKLCIQSAGTSICSGLVADAYTRAGVVWERPPYDMMPADIAFHFDFRYTDGI